MLFTMTKLLTKGLALAVLSAPFVLYGGDVAAQKLKVALALPGAVSDKGFNAGAHAGLMIVKERGGAEVAFSENVKRPDFVATLRDFANRDFNVIIAHGFQWGDATEKVSAEFPKKHFINTYGFGKGENLANLHIAYEQLFYIMGQLAVKMSKKKNIGAVGGWEIPPIRIQVDAFRRGALAADPNVKVNTIFTGTFYDAVKGKEATRALISQGSELVAHMADATGLGVIEAARAANILTMGYFADQQHLAPDHVVTSAIMKTDEMIFRAVQSIEKGTFKAGNIFYSFNEGILEIGKFGPMVSDDVKKEVNELVEKIKSGEVKVPPPNVPELMKATINKM